MIRLSDQERLVVTGAGGWLGQELLEILLVAHGSLALTKNVYCLGSNRRSISLSDGTQIEIEPLGEKIDYPKVAGVVHLGFLTRDKVEQFGVREYSFENLQITSKAVRLIEAVKPRFIATVSSGAVLSSPNGPLENDISANPYGFTKRVEEAMLREVAKTTGANLAIGRLWGAIGAHMPLNRAYAVSDFIWQAATNREINIRSSRRVFRRYVAAGHFMDVLTTAAQDLALSEFDSGGRLIEMSDLADLVGSHFGGLQVNRNLDSGLDADDYYPKNDDFEKLEHTLGLGVENFELELQKTVEHQLKGLLDFK